MTGTPELSAFGFGVFNPRHKTKAERDAELDAVLLTDARAPTYHMGVLCDMTAPS